MKNHTFFRKLGKISRNLSSAVGMISDLRVITNMSPYESDVLFRDTCK